MKTLKKSANVEDDPEEEEDNISGMLPQINFEKLFKAEEKILTQDYPFTNSFYDDVIWLKK